MAKKTSNVLDMTKTGPLSFRQLQELNVLSPESTQILSGPSGSMSALEGVGQINYDNNPAYKDFGESRHDSDLVGADELAQYQGLRGDRQPWYEQIGAGLAKGAILAGTTFLDGTLGLLVGTGEALYRGDISGLYDNAFSRAMKSLNDWSEEAMPNYYTEEEQNSPWYTNIFTANFIGDKFIKNLGFSVGALYSGGVTSAGLKFTKIPELVGIIANSTKAPAMVSSSIGALTSAVNEGRIEALNNSEDWQNLKMQELDDIWRDRLNSKYASDMEDIRNGYREALEEYEATKGNLQRIETEDGTAIIDPASQRYDAKIAALQAKSVALQRAMDYEWNNREADDSYRKIVGRIEEDRLKMGNTDMLMNLPILTASNLVQFTKFYSNGFNTARRAGVKSTRDAATGAIQYAGENLSKGKVALKIAQGAMAEGTEEISQGAASRIAGNYYATDVNNFTKAQIDPNAERETLSWMKAFASGINETVNDGSSWEEFFIGALTGAMGIPTFRSMKASDGSFRLPIEIQGGAYNEFKEYQSEIARSQEIADYLNSRVQSPEFLNYYQGLIRHNKYQNDMNQAVEDDDRFTFKNAELAQFVSDIVMFDNAGRLGDLRAFIDSADDMSDENLQSIIENTTSTITDENGIERKVGPFIDKNGNPMTDTEEGKEEMIERLSQSRDSMLNAINTYRRAKNDIDIQTGGTLTDEQLSELTWMNVQLENWADRNIEIAKEVKPFINDIIGNLRTEYDFWESLKPEEKNYSGITNEKINEKTQSLKFAISSLQTLAEIKDSSLSTVLSNNPEIVKGIKEELAELDPSVLPNSKLKEVNQKLDDLVRIGDATKLYSKKLQEYLSNPQKLAEDQATARQAVADEVNQEKADEVKSKLASAQNISEFRQAFNAEQDSDLKNKALAELEAEGNENAKNFIEIGQYDNEVLQALNSLGESAQVLQDANTLWRNQLNAANELKEAANPSSIYINDDQSFIDYVGGNVEEGSRRFQEARYALQKALNIVNNNIKFRDRFSDEYKRPVDENIKGKGVDKDSTGDSGTSTVPSVNTKKNAIPDTNNIPVGNITPQMVLGENEDMNKRVETQRNLDQSQKGQRQYYRPAIPELHIEGSKEGDFRPFDQVVAEREPGVDFSGIYDYLRANGAFSYVNAAKIKPGDEVGFMVDPDFNDNTIFMVDTRNNQIIGSLDESSASVARYEGLQGLIDKVKTEYSAHKAKQTASEKASRFFATPTTKVSKMMVGRIPYTTEERSLSAIPNVTTENGATAQPMLGIIKNGMLTTNDKIDDRLVIKPVDMAQKEGRLYLLIPNAAGTYSPAAVRVKHFNRQEFNLDDATINSTPIGQSINSALDRLSEAEGQDDVSAAVKELAQDLYMQDVMITWFDANAGSGIVISKKIKNPDGSYKMININGQDQIKEDKTSIYFQDSKEEVSLSNGLSADYGAAEVGGNIDMALFGKPKSVEVIKRDIMNTLLGYNLPIQVSVSKINTTGYNNRLIKSNILSSNLREASVIGSWFTTDYFDNNGELRQAISPASVKPAPGRKISSPVGGTEGVVEGTRIVVNNTNYIVDLESSIITNESTGERRGFRKGDEPLIEMAWAQNTFGNATESSKMTENKVITPSGKVLDRTTGEYLNQEEADRIKNKLAGLEKDREARIANAQRVEARIAENQNRVDKTRTDSDYYYVLEEDGEYHPYDRVHKRLGDNWAQSPAQAQALKGISDRLVELKGDINQFNNYLDFLANDKYKQYGLDFTEFKGKTDNNSINMVVTTIRDMMAGTQSRRALEAGSAIDSVIRQFFTRKDSDPMPSRPSNLNDSAYNLLITRLNEIKSNLQSRGERFLTNNVVLFHKYQDGTRIAGEVDILAVDRNGNFKIYDVKTSKYSFEYFIKDGQLVNYFEGKAPAQRMSNKDYYTLQLSGYQNLFESQYGTPIARLAILPFVLGYSGNMVTNIVGQKGIPIEYNPAVNVPLVSSTIIEREQEKVEQPKKKEDVGTDLTIFDSTWETLNPVNRVTPEDNFAEGDTKVGYYEQDGKMYKGYLKKLGDFHGVPVYLTKFRDRGFGRPGELGSTSEYIAVFPNGKAIKAVRNGTSDAQGESITRDALNKNPDKVAAWAAEATQIQPKVTVDSGTTTQTSSEISGAQQAVQREVAINNKAAKRTRHKLRQTTSDNTTVWDRKKEMAWLDKVLPQLSSEDRVRVMNGLIQVAENGPTAWGMFNDGIVTLSDIAAEGTVYHEAFHVVFNTMLNDTQRGAILKEAEALYGKKSILELEEDMAESFREYTMDRQSRSLGRRILDFFKDILAKITHRNQMQPHLTALYSAINKGKYSNKEIRDTMERFKPSDRGKDSNWNTIDSTTREQLANKGWTKERFNSVSALERENAIECASL